MGQGELVTLEAMLSEMRSDELDARATRAQRHLGGKVAVAGFESILIGRCPSRASVLSSACRC